MSSIKSSKYLYGVEPSAWRDMPYVEALRAKVGFALLHKKAIAKEASKYTHDPFKYMQYVTHYNYVEKAIEFNKKMIEELEDE